MIEDLNAVLESLTDEELEELYYSVWAKLLNRGILKEND